MNRAVRIAAVATSLLAASAARATPSTAFWTPATTYVQPYLVPHLTYDTYFAQSGAYPIITGLTMGLLPLEKLQAEIGFDLNYPGKGSAVLQLNGKLGAPEGAFGAYFPGVSGGIMAAGVKQGVTTYDMLHAEVSKTLPALGVVTVGAYYGLDEKLFVDENGNVARAGVLASYVTPDWKVKAPALDKLNAVVDVQTGRNAFGAVGAAVGIYFTPTIDVLAGPVFFLNSAAQPGGASWMWSMQLDVDFDLRRR